MKNNDIGFLFKINNVCNAVKKADIYLVPGSKETARQTASCGASLLHPACVVRGREARWLGVDRTVRIKAKKHHHYCYLLPVGERSGLGVWGGRFILAAGLDVCQNERELRSEAEDLGSRMQEMWAWAGQSPAPVCPVVRLGRDRTLSPTQMSKGHSPSNQCK